jgi:hypothetical protein
MMNVMKKLKRSLKVYRLDNYFETDPDTDGLDSELSLLSVDAVDALLPEVAVGLDIELSLRCGSEYFR